MRFAVTRTSVWDEETQPCKEAVRGELDRWDVRTFKSPEEHDARLAAHGKWHDSGTDHQNVYGPRGAVVGIKRNMGPQTAWFVEFSSLDDLMAFYKRYGDLVITGAFANESVPRIEIYDGYRE